jgi:hypothetical protein
MKQVAYEIKYSIYTIFFVFSGLNNSVNAQNYCHYNTLDAIFNISKPQEQAYIATNYNRKFNINRRQIIRCFQGKDSCATWNITFDSIRFLGLYFNNGYVPKICKKLPNLSMASISTSVSPTIQRLFFLKQLELNTTQGLKNLQLPSLEHIASEAVYFNNTQLQQICSQNTNLKTLKLKTDINDTLNTATINHFLALKYLENLSLEITNTNNFPIQILQMRRLKYLSLSFPTNIGVNSVKSEKLQIQIFENIRDLKGLIIKYYCFSNILEVLPELTNLEVLEINLDEYKDNTEIVRTLQQMPKLQCVHLFSDSTRQKELEALLPFKNCDCKD